MPAACDYHLPRYIIHSKEGNYKPLKPVAAPQALVGRYQKNLMHDFLTMSNISESDCYHKEAFLRLSTNLEALIKDPTISPDQKAQLVQSVHNNRQDLVTLLLSQGHDDILKGMIQNFGNSFNHQTKYEIFAMAGRELFLVMSQYNKESLTEIQNEMINAGFDPLMVHEFRAEKIDWEKVEHLHSKENLGFDVLNENGRPLLSMISKKLSYGNAEVAKQAELDVDKFLSLLSDSERIKVLNQKISYPNGYFGRVLNQYDSFNFLEELCVATGERNIGFERFKTLFEKYSKNGAKVVDSFATFNRVMMSYDRYRDEEFEPFLKFCIQKGVLDLNQTDADGNTYVMNRIRATGQPKLFKLLFSMGAKLTIKNAQGQDAMDVLKSYGPKGGVNSVSKDLYELIEVAYNIEKDNLLGDLRRSLFKYRYIAN